MKINMKQWKSSVVKIWPANCFYHCFHCTPWNKEHLESRPLLHFQLVPSLWFVVAILSRCEKPVAGSTTSIFQRALPGLRYTATATLKWTISSQTPHCVLFCGANGILLPLVMQDKSWVFSHRSSTHRAGANTHVTKWQSRQLQAKIRAQVLPLYWRQSDPRTSLGIVGIIITDLEFTHKDIWD